MSKEIQLSELESAAWEISLHASRGMLSSFIGRAIVEFGSSSSNERIFYVQGGFWNSSVLQGSIALEARSLVLIGEALKKKYKYCWKENDLRFFNELICYREYLSHPYFKLEDWREEKVREFVKKELQKIKYPPAFFAATLEDLHVLWHQKKINQKPFGNKNIDIKHPDLVPTFRAALFSYIQPKSRSLITTEACEKYLAKYKTIFEQQTESTLEELRENPRSDIGA